MGRNDSRTLIALGLILLLSPWPGWSASVPVGKVVPRAGTSLLNGIEVKLPTTLFSGDKIATQQEGWALLLLSPEGRVYLGPASSAAVRGNADELVVQLDRGFTVARSGRNRAISFAARGLELRPSGAATYEVAVSEKAIVVSSHEGSVEVKGADRALTVPAGRSARFEKVDNTQGAGTQSRLSGGARAAIWILVATGVAAAIAIPLALKDGAAVVSPAAP